MSKFDVKQGTEPNCGAICLGYYLQQSKKLSVGETLSDTIAFLSTDKDTRVMAEYDGLGLICDPIRIITEIQKHDAEAKFYMPTEHLLSYFIEIVCKKNEVEVDEFLVNENPTDIHENKYGIMVYQTEEEKPRLHYIFFFWHENKFYYANPWDGNWIAQGDKGKWGNLTTISPSEKGVPPECINPLGEGLTLNYLNIGIIIAEQGID